jgi:hypothetical protein
MTSTVEKQVAGAKRRFFLPWLGTVAAVLALAGLGFALVGDIGQRGAQLPALAKWMTAAGLVWCGLLLFVRQQILTPLGIAARLPAPDATAIVRHLLAGYLVLWAAAVAPAIIGIAQILAGGDERMHLLLCAAALLVLAYLMPAQAKLAAQAGGAMAILEKVRDQTTGGPHPPT